MNTAVARVVAPSVVKTPGVRWPMIQKVGNRLSALLGFLAVLTFSAPAHAATTGLLGGAETSFFGTITSFLTANLLPLVFTLAAVVIGATMLIKYGRKAVSS